MDILEKERMDIEVWRESEHESPGSDSVHNIVNKMTDVPSLLECQQPHDAVFRAADTVLELGAGQGWASCLFKRLYPQARYTATDISEHAVASVPKWERLFDARLEGTIACQSYDIPVEDGSFDVVFAYAAAHHFMLHRKTLREIFRILRPGGHAFYFHEPLCRKWIYKAAYRRVNGSTIRPDGVAEDVLVYPKILRIAREEGLEANLAFAPTLHKRRPFEFMYYFFLRQVPILQRLVPSTGTFHFVKPRSSGKPGDISATDAMGKAP